MPFGQLGQTITVVNKSGKVVSTSKQLVNVWKEAKAAYRERKAEINATRTVEFDERRARKALQHITLEDDNVSRASSKRSKHPSRAKSHRHVDRPHVDRGYTDSFYANDNIDVGRGIDPPPPGVYVDQEFANGVHDNQRHELIRRHTDAEHFSLQIPRRHSAPEHSPRSSIDMDLAYGDLPPPLPERRHGEEEEMRAQMSKLTMMLDEANCLQHSATAMIEHLQQNPDALAAVGLTLAEISNLAAKMAPGALTALKGAFPAVIALLASPQFLIAAGVGVGVTVVMLGGYKIIKRIKDRPQPERALEAPFEATPFQAAPLEIQEDELQEIETQDLGRIENWRRGIADAESQSVGTTVDGEFITPGASRYLIESGMLREEDLKSTRSRSTRGGKSRKSVSEAGKSKKHHKEHREHKERRSSRDDASYVSSRSGSVKEKEGKRKKAVGGIKMLFQGHSTVA